MCLLRTSSLGKTAPPPSQHRLSCMSTHVACRSLADSRRGEAGSGGGGGGSGDEGRRVAVTALFPLSQRRLSHMLTHVTCGSLANSGRGDAAAARAEGWWRRQ